MHAQLASKRQGAAQDVEVWHENLITLELFLSMSTQWDIQPMTGQRIGLKWSSLEVAIRNHPALINESITRRAEIFNDIQRMEIAAITEIREQERERKANE